MNKTGTIQVAQTRQPDYDLHLAKLVHNQIKAIADKPGNEAYRAVFRNAQGMLVAGYLTIGCFGYAKQQDVGKMG